MIVKEEWKGSITTFLLKLNILQQTNTQSINSFSFQYKTKDKEEKNLGEGISHPGRCLRPHLYQREVGKVWIAMTMVTMTMMRMGWQQTNS